MASSNQEFTITRSQASQLVAKHSNGGHVLSVFQARCDTTTIFDNVNLSKIMSLMEKIFKCIEKLKSCPNIYYSDESALVAASHLSRINIYRLHQAVDNYFYKCAEQEGEPVTKEDLNDNCLETNTCTVCQVKKKTVYYFSTYYGLDLPVCGGCLDEGESKEDKDEDYVVEEEDEEDASEEEEEDDEEEDGEEDGVEGVEPLEEDDEDDEEEEEDDEDDEDEDYVVEEEDDASEDEEDDDEDSESEEEDSESDESDGEEPLEGIPPDCNCEECTSPNEYERGWKAGWKSALKHVKAYAQTELHAPAFPPNCANCHLACSYLKRCGGTCNSNIQYCSYDCQREHWYYKHNKVCSI